MHETRFGVVIIRQPRLDLFVGQVQLMVGFFKVGGRIIRSKGADRSGQQGREYDSKTHGKKSPKSKNEKFAQSPAEDKTSGKAYHQNMAPKSGNRFRDKDMLKKTGA